MVNNASVELAISGCVCFFVAFVDRANVRHIISLRKANSREIKHYAQT